MQQDFYTFSDRRDADFFIESYPLARTLAVAFTSYGQDDIPPDVFEWWDHLHRFDVNRIFLRDSQQQWYMRGVAGFGDSCEAIADHILSFVEQHPVDRIVTIGSSMAGFAALKIGGLIEADEAIVFSANYSCRRAFREAHDEFRGAARLRDLEEAGLGCDIDQRVPPFTNYYDDNFIGDAHHASALAALEGARSVTVPGGGHFVARAMSRTNRIDAILSEALRLPPRDAALPH